MTTKFKIDDKEEYKKYLDDICSEDCPPEQHCILKLFLVSSHPSPRLLMQLKCVDKFKYEESKALGYDIGMGMAMQRWAEEGFALKFAIEYTEEIKLNALYKKIRHG